MEHNATRVNFGHDRGREENNNKPDQLADAPNGHRLPDAARTKTFSASRVRSHFAERHIVYR